MEEQPEENDKSPTDILWEDINRRLDISFQKSTLVTPNTTAKHVCTDFLKFHLLVFEIFYMIIPFLDFVRIVVFDIYNSHLARWCLYETRKHGIGEKRKHCTNRSTSSIKTVT